MKTWQRTGSAATAATTTWVYYDNTGWLYCKDYPDAATGQPPETHGIQGPSYEYSPAGRLYHRQLLEGLTTYTHDNAGDLSAVSYQRWDTTPAISYTRDRLGRQTQVTSTDQWLNSWDCNLAYNYAGQLVSESYSAGPLDGLVVTNTFDHSMRRTNLALLNGASTLAGAGYTYDGASRLATVSDGSNVAGYSYVANSPLVGQIGFTNNGVRRMLTTKSWDYLNRLTWIASSPAASPAVSVSYNHNDANQRTRAALADGAYWRYEYDSLGQVKSGRKFWADGAPVAGQQFEYGFDDIGNRISAKAGGDENGGSLRSAAYSPNSLNQYSSRTVPGAADIMGMSFATNTVTINGQAAFRKGEYFRKEFTVNNTSSALWTNITVAATGQTSVSGHEFVPQTPESFSYDFDGNLVSDGRWNYGWDAENRLVAMTNRAAVGPQQVLRFEYDSKSRRIRKQVWDNSTGTGSPTNDVRFAYDGWNLVATLASDLQPLASFTWGLDLSGSLQGAGGVGGLLRVTYIGTQTTNCFAAFDGNGNLAGLIDASNGGMAAQYEYGPFGEVLRATGPMATANPFRFSTKYQDDETDLLYYGYRLYNASTGRWISRDPAEEKGTGDPYCFVRNDPWTSLDPDGTITVNILSATARCCGGAAVFFRFMLDRPAAEEGWIVQKNTTDVPWESCDGILHGSLFNEPQMWEAWHVPANATAPDQSYPDGSHDEVSWDGKNDTTGAGGTDGTLKFFYKSHPGVGDLSDWSTRISSPSSGALPSTRKEPEWWNQPSDNGEVSATRSVHTTWDCCCPAHISFLIASPGGVTHVHRGVCE